MAEQFGRCLELRVAAAAPELLECPVSHHSMRLLDRSATGRMCQIRPCNVQVTLVAESFGGCLGLRVAAAAPELLERLVLINPATSFSRALGGLPGVIASTNLLSLFPEPLYQLAQAVLVPLLVDKDNVGPSGLKAITGMMTMRPTPDFNAVTGFMDQEQSARERSTARAAFQLYTPAVTASWRLRLLRKGNLPDAELAKIRAPTLIVASAADRLLPSLEESGRLVRAIPSAQRVILPNSGHTALLESGISLAAIMDRTGFLPESPPQRREQPATALNDTAANTAPPTSAPRQVPIQAAASASNEAPSNSGTASSSATASQYEAQIAWNGNGSSNGAVKVYTPANAEGGASSTANSGSRTGSTSASNGSLTAAFSNSGNTNSIAGNGSDLSSENNGASSDGASSSVVNAPDQAAGFQQRSPQEMRKGSTWGPDAGSRGKSRRRRVARDEIDENYEESLRLLSPLRALVAPVVRGAENVPDGAVKERGVLFVGNHTQFGLYDLPFLMYELYLRGHKVRGLAHPEHWQGPQGALFNRFGAVKASPLAAYKLLRQRESVLLFPGGGREVNKLKGEKYKLIWKDSPDFVRLASKLDCTIVPFASVGGDDAFDLALDTEELLRNPILGPLAAGTLERFAPGLDPREALFPVTRGPLGLPSLVPIPRLERLYFKFMPPIEAADVLCSLDNEDSCMDTYQQVKSSIEHGLRELLQEREVDRERELGPRILGQAARFLPAFDLLQGFGSRQ